MGVVYSPVSIAPKLIPKGFINDQTLREITTDGISDDSKAATLAQHCCQYITLHDDPESKLNELLQILEAVEPAATSVVKMIRQVSCIILQHVVSLALILSLSLSPPSH